MDRKRILIAAAGALALIAAVIAVALAGGGGDEGKRQPAPPTVTDPAEKPPPPRERSSRGRKEDDSRSRRRARSRRDGAAPGAPGDLVVGIGNQTTDHFFDDPRFRALGIRHVRLVAPWNAALAEPRETAEWLAGARRAGAEPLIAFNHSRGDSCPGRPCHAPTVSEFERAFSAFRSRFPEVTTFSTWNEPNHPSQPVADDPELVASYHRILRERCRGCTVLAADFVADASAPAYIAAFRRAGGPRARLWGVHNYPDTNRFTSRGTRRFLELVDGPVWITETGGIVEFTTASGRTAFPYDERRAARATRQMFEVARLDRRIERLYVYQWRKTAPEDRFDAGLIRLDGEARPAYRVLRRELRR